MYNILTRVLSMRKRKNNNEGKTTTFSTLPIINLLNATADILLMLGDSNREPATSC